MSHYTSFRTRRLLVVGVLLALIASPSSAQSIAGESRSNTRGFFAAFGIGGSSIEVEELDDDRESGGGAALRLGYGFTPRFALFLEGNGAVLEGDQGDIALGHFDIGARYHFANASRALVPFVDAAFSGRALTQDDWAVTDEGGEVVEGDLEISGAGFSFGGGVLYFLRRTWALNADVRWTVGEFSDVTVGRVTISGFEMDATSTRLNLGVHWFPQRPAR